MKIWRILTLTIVLVSIGAPLVGGVHDRTGDSGVSDTRRLCTWPD